MPSIIKVDQIQSDTGNVAFTGNIAFPAGSASSPSITAVGDTNTGIFFPAADTIALTEGGTEVVRISSTANVGIDQTSPSEKLDIWANRNSGDGAIVIRTQFGAHYFGGVGNYPAFGYKIGNTFHAALAFDTNNNFHFTGPDSSKFPAFFCRAWVVFNGAGTVSVRASGNVSSITDNGTGDYTVNFTTAMPDINYSVGGNGAGTLNSDSCGPAGLGGADNYRSTTSLRFGYWYFTSNSLTDRDYINLQIFR
jgi:hypothetical protein